MGSREWLHEIRKAKKETAEGDTRCRGCEGEAKTVLVLGAQTGPDTTPAARVRLCQGCAEKWLSRDPEMVEKLKPLWEDLV